KRVKNREALVPALNAEFGRRPVAGWLKRLDDAGVPAGRIKTVAEVCESDHLRERGMFVKVAHAKAGAVTSIGVPIRLLGTPGAAQSPSPLLGEPTDEILGSLLKIPKAKVHKLRAAGVV